MQTKTLPSYKFVDPLRDTPRSVTVIPEELIKQTNATTFADALKTVPGITFLGGDAAANPSADRPVIRGFESRNSIFVDGMRDSGVQNRETFDIENISVIKGPDSVYAGRGAVGGSIDITTKTPRLEDVTNASLGFGFGTDSYKRLTLDVNRQLNDQTAVRLNAMGFDADQAGRTNVYSKRWGIAPSVAFGLNSPTTVTFSYYHLNSYDMPDFSAPFRSAGGTPDGGFQRNQFYGLNNRDYRRGQTDTGEIKIEHRLNDTWKVKNTTMVGRSTLDYVATNPQFQSASSNIISLQAKSGKYATNSIANQTELTGKATLFGFEHTLTGGVECSNEHAHRCGLGLPVRQREALGALAAQRRHAPRSLRRSRGAGRCAGPEEHLDPVQLPTGRGLQGTADTEPVRVVRHVGEPAGREQWSGRWHGPDYDGQLEPLA